VYLLNAGFRVGAIDVDARQGTFTQYFENRKASAIKNPKLKIPHLVAIQKSDISNKEEAIVAEHERFSDALKANSMNDFVIIDTPGNDTFLSQLAHSYANTLITPINESFVDLDVLVKISQENIKTFRPSIYAEMVWNQRKERAIRGAKPIDWIVVKNRMATLYNKNRGDINIVLEALAKRIDFRLGSGFCERVIFKELFLSGMTLLDIESNNNQISLSHVAARQELRELINFIKIPVLQNLQTTAS
jgi:chromosome partitioning protein